MTVFWDAKFFLHGRVSLEGSFIHEQTDYSKAALRYDLGRLQDAWRKFQRSRARDAVYCFLEEIFDLAAWWKAEGRSRSRIDRVLAIKSVPRPKLTSNSTAYAVLIRAAAHPEPKPSSARVAGDRKCQTSHKSEAEILGSKRISHKPVQTNCADSTGGGHGQLSDLRGQDSM
jgi:hypothetical protein